jgi:outer membrane protein OmpA-like peptidoglycan-associated protein
MKRLQRYEEFRNNQVQEEIDWKNLTAAGLATIGSIVGSPQKVSGQTKTPTEIITTVGKISKDVLGRTLTKAPSTKTETIKPSVYLVTKEIVNPSIKKDAELKAKGYIIVWTDTVKSKTEVDTLEGKTKPPVVMKSDNDKFFELGGYTLTKEVRERISGQVKQLGGVDSVEVESSTDKTPLTKKLKADLESKGYSGDNKGLSKARSNAIRDFLTSLGIDPSKIVEINLSDQGEEGGYDPSARYVKLILIENGSTTDVGEQGPEENDKVIVYYQRISDTKQKKPTGGGTGDYETGGGHCPIYR